MQINYNVQGADRKALVQAISEITALPVCHIFLINSISFVLIIFKNLRMYMRKYTFYRTTVN